jgi:formamidopyrimidine-DNA glycosylase
MFIYFVGFLLHMPELPEVETIVNQLNSKLAGKTIESVEIFDNKMVDSEIENVFPSKVKRVYRRAKSIIMELSNEKFLVTQLRMTGHFKFNGSEKFRVAKFNLKDTSLTHHSIRRFGSIKLFNKEALNIELSKYGPEPLSNEFKEEQFIEMLSSKKSNIKTLLLDPYFIAGIGNIYVQEALYFAGISPLRKANDLNLEESAKLFLEIRRILLLAIEHKGSTVDNYTNVEGTGGFQNFLAVYSKDFCPKEHLLTQVKIGGRGTMWCKECQN